MYIDIRTTYKAIYNKDIEMIHSIHPRTVTITHDAHSARFSFVHYVKPTTSIRRRPINRRMSTPTRSRRDMLAAGRCRTEITSISSIILWSFITVEFPCPGCQPLLLKAGGAYGGADPNRTDLEVGMTGNALFTLGRPFYSTLR